MLIKEEYFAAMKGTTDSEHIAALYMTYLDAGSGGAGEKTFSVRAMRDALKIAIKDVQEVQKNVLTEQELAKAANSLNLVASMSDFPHTMNIPDMSVL
jgi:glutamine amidotransferase